MRIVLPALILAAAIALACGPKTDLAKTEANAARAAQTPAPTPMEQLTSQAVLDAFKAAGFPLKRIEVYTDANDPNHLLGRPHQYVGKINFDDGRVKDLKPSPECTIEVFASQEDLDGRKNYTETVTKIGPFAQYSYVHKNVLLRLDHGILPKDAAEYERVLNAL